MFRYLLRTSKEFSLFFATMHRLISSSESRKMKIGKVVEMMSIRGGNRIVG